MFNGARIVGPAVAGMLVATIGEGWCFFANGVSYIAVIAGLLMMHVTRHERTSSASPLADVVEGFRFVMRNAPIHALLILLGLVSLAGMPYAVLMPIFADQILHGGAAGAGLLMGASGVGALAGALVLATRRDVRGLGRWVAISGAAFCVSLIAFGFSRVVLAFGRAPAARRLRHDDPDGASNTLIQTMSPDSLRGRVMSVYSMMFMGMAPIGALLAGAVADRIGAPLAVAGGGAICLAASGVFAVWLPRIAGERPAN